MTFPLKLTRPLVSFDVETTSKDPYTARIVSIGLDKVMPDGEIVPWHKLINPGVPIPAESTEKHEITDDMVVEAPRFEELAPRLFKGFSECDLLGYNVNRFDYTVLRNEFQRCGFEWNPDVYVIDVLRLWQIVQPRSLTDAVKFWLNREPTAAHSADGDATDALQVFIAMLTRTNSEEALFPVRLPYDLKALHELQWPTDPSWVDKKGQLVRDANGATCFNFGMHRGKTLVSERRYAEWWAKEPNRTFEQRTIVQDVLKGIRK